MRKTLNILVLAAALAVNSNAFAAGESAGPGAAKGRWLGKAEVEVKVTELGYSVRKIQNGVGRYEVKATGKDGSEVLLYIDPWTGELLNPDNKNGDRH